MPAVDQDMLNAIRTVVAEVVTPLFQGLNTRLEGVETRVQGLEMRLGTLEARTDRLESQLETLDIRTSQMANDLFTMRDTLSLLQERVDHGFQSLKSDLRAAFGDIRNLRATQELHTKSITTLKEEIAVLQRRLHELEGARGQA